MLYAEEFYRLVGEKTADSLLHFKVNGNLHEITEHLCAVAYSYNALQMTSGGPPVTAFNITDRVAIQNSVVAIVASAAHAVTVAGRQEVAIADIMAAERALYCQIWPFCRG